MSKEKRKPRLIWSAQLMPSNEKCNMCLQSCSAIIWGTSNTMSQSWRRNKGVRATWAASQVSVRVRQTLSRLCFSGARRFMCYPFQEHIEVDSLASNISTLFHLNSSGVEDEMLTLQADIQLKARAHGQFWNLLTEEKYPKWGNMHATLLTALFDFIYLCQPKQLHVTFIHSRHSYRVKSLVFVHIE